MFKPSDKIRGLLGFINNSTVALANLYGLLSIYSLLNCFYSL